MTTKPDTHDLATALGVAVRTLHLWRRQGLTTPGPEESLEAWVERARAWRASTRKRSAPVAGEKDSKTAADVRFRQLRAQKLEIEISVLKGRLHDRNECERSFVARCVELRAAFGQLPDRLARRLYQAPSPDSIKVQVEDELRRCFAVLAGEEVPPVE